MSVKKIENFLRQDLYEYTLRTAQQLLLAGENTFSTNLHWSPRIVKDSFPVFVHRIDKNSEFFNALKDNIETKTGLNIGEETDIMLYYWTRHSYIPWHDDGQHYGALTVYLNPSWDLDYGGYFLYEDVDNEIKAIVPQKNLAVLQLDNVKHCTTPVNFDGDIRLSIQVFFSKKYNQKQNDEHSRIKILKFTSTSCEVCKYVSEMIKEMNLQIAVEDIDVEKNEKMAKNYSVDGWPTLIMVKDNVEIKRIVGPQTEEQILNWINN